MSILSNTPRGPALVLKLSVNDLTKILELLLFRDNYELTWRQDFMSCFTKSRHLYPKLIYICSHSLLGLLVAVSVGL